MQDVKVRRGFIDLTSNRTLSIFLFLLGVLLVGAYLLNLSRTSGATSLPKGTITISQAALEEKYGLHLNLVAITAAGGFVDVRLKILDSEKAKSLLQDKNNFPSLYTNDAVRLNVPAEGKQEEIRFEKNGILFFMYPNAGNAVRRGDQVRIIFGNLALEPTVVQ